MQHSAKADKIAKLRSLGRCEFWSYAAKRHGTGQVAILAEDWLREQSSAVRAKFLARWQFLRQQEGKDWRRKAFDHLRGEGKGLGEIRFEILGVQHRPLGFHEPITFTIVFFAIEKGDKFEPKHACSTSLQRKKEILSGHVHRKEMNLELLLD